MTMNVSESDVVPDGIGQGAERYDRIMPHHHDALFRAQDGICDASVHRENGWQCCINLGSKLAEDLLRLLHQEAIHILNRLVFVLLTGQQETAGDIRQPNDLHASNGGVEEMQPRLPNYR